MILSSGVDFYGKRVSSFAEHWQKKYDSIKRSGLVEFPMIYDQIKDYFFKGICQAMRDEKYGFVNTQGKEVIAFIYDFVSLSNSGDGSIMAYLNGKRVYMDLQVNLKTGD